LLSGNCTKARENNFGEDHTLIRNADKFMKLRC
jgi:hypothetical protein